MKIGRESYERYLSASSEHDAFQALLLYYDGQLKNCLIYRLHEQDAAAGYAKPTVFFEQLLHVEETVDLSMGIYFLSQVMPKIHKQHTRYELLVPKKGRESYFATLCLLGSISKSVVTLESIVEKHGYNKEEYYGVAYCVDKKEATRETEIELTEVGDLPTSVLDECDSQQLPFISNFQTQLVGHNLW